MFSSSIQLRIPWDFSVACSSCDGPSTTQHQYSGRTTRMSLSGAPEHLQQLFTTCTSTFSGPTAHHYSAGNGFGPLLWQRPLYALPHTSTPRSISGTDAVRAAASSSRSRPYLQSVTPGG
ncbi:hypothetical protein VaNZ11_013497 [Volvox africanus]|uniref:Uncharacterized protein n=1 Tax=Volvox africanus TaxID=51714 RepID=A0ABQ5SGS5_9CHLO|nr:hypothetical protein VaNZ11_013497 [Volvox africanus]